MEFLGPESDESQPASRSSRLLLTTKLKLMDVKELQENCNCANCVRCFDEYSHYSWLTFAPLPPKDDKRYYCNKHYKYVMPNEIRICFEDW